VHPLDRVRHQDGVVLDTVHEDDPRPGVGVDRFLVVRGRDHILPVHGLLFDRHALHVKGSELSHLIFLHNPAELVGTGVFGNTTAQAATGTARPRTPETPGGLHHTGHATKT